MQNLLYIVFVESWSQPYWDMESAIGKRHPAGIQEFEKFAMEELEKLPVDRWAPKPQNPKNPKPQNPSKVFKYSTPK